MLPTKSIFLPPLPLVVSFPYSLRLSAISDLSSFPFLSRLVHAVSFLFESELRIYSLVRSITPRFPSATDSLSLLKGFVGTHAQDGTVHTVRSRSGPQRFCGSVPAAFGSMRSNFRIPCLFVSGN